MQLKIVQISSSNQRPVDHKDFKADVITPAEILLDNAETWSWIQTYVTQGDRVVVERIL